MSSTEESGRYEQRQEEREAIEGTERIALLPVAQFIAVAPGLDEDPPYVWIQWVPGVVERPYPGTAIWRAALERYLASPMVEGGTTRVIRPLVAAALARFRSLEAWLRWMDFERPLPRGPGGRPPISGPGWPW
jgi:hypothetical protein